MRLKAMLCFLSLLALCACVSTQQKPTQGPYSRSAKLVTREAKDGLGAGKQGVVFEEEVDLKDYEELLKEVNMEEEIDGKPKPIDMAAPNYPVFLLRKGIEGFVIIHFVVDEKGLVESAEVKLATHKDFGDAAIAAVRSWRFEPMTKDGQPTKVAFRQRIPFRLK